MYRIASIFLTGLFTLTIFSQEATFKGKLEPQLFVDTVHIYQRAWVAADVSKLKFSAPPEKNAIVSEGDLIDQRSETGKTHILMVEPPAAAPYLWLDTDRDGVFEADEKTAMDVDAKRPDIVTVTLQLPIKNQFYSKFPIFVHYIRGFKHPKLAANERLIAQSAYVVARARVEIKGKSVLFQYPFEPGQERISTTEGLFGIDQNCDGQIRNEEFSPETSYADKDEIVFPLGDTFVSTSHIDMATGRVVIRQREKSEYQRIDLDVGVQMPDFSFVDLEGKQRSLAEFRGKYLLVDFWGVWCIDCTRETPYHIAAYKKFKGRNFEILGLNTDEKIETLRDYLKKNDISWPQATNDSIKKLVSVSYRIQEYPSTVLLGPDGKVLVLKQQFLRGENLIDTLEKILPKPKTDK